MGLGRAALAVRSAMGGDDDAAERLVEQLATLRGLPQKFGQLLAVGESGAPDSRFAALSEAPSPLAPELARAAIERELGAPIDSHFRVLETEAVAASLGQVHRGVLRDGRSVAVKLQYPGVAEAVRSDLRALGWVARPLARHLRGLSLQAWREELALRIEEELDYVHEARSIEAFGASVAGLAGVVVPSIVPELCRPRLIVMDWIEGEPLSAACTWRDAERRALADTLVSLFLHGALGTGLLHADPHPGNYRFQRGPAPTVALLDFGSTRRLDDAERAALRELLVSGAQKAGPAEPERVLACLVALGFSPDLLAPMAETLPELARLVCAPLGGGPPCRDLGRRLGELLGANRWAFRVAGPPTLLLVMRAYHGLLCQLEALGSPPVSSGILGAALASSQGLGTALDPSTPHGDAAAGAAQAKHLRVRVSRGGRAQVDITFRAQAARHLEGLVPDELLPRLAEKGIDVVAVAKEAVESGLAPGPLFELDDEEKCVCVWLE